MKRIFVVVVACCFENKDKLCQTCIKRMNIALNYSENLLDSPDKKVHYIVTGHVPFEKGEVTMAELQRKYFMSKGVPETDISIGQGVGIFSESKLICLEMWRKITRDDSQKFYVASSDFYLGPNWCPFFGPGRPIWKVAAENNNLSVDFITVYGTGGLQTYATYFIYACLYWFSRVTGLVWMMDKLLTKSQSSRVNGFKFKGCA
jgi:hypothetical protein